MNDKNGIKVKHRDIIKINAEWYSKKETIDAVWQRGKKMEVFNPNCCKFCREMRGSIIGIGAFLPEQIEVIGNLDTTPDLLPLKDFTPPD